MTDYAFPPPAVTSLAIAGSELAFPVHRVYCVGRNYAAHTREMGKDPDRDPPFFFSKPADAVVPGGTVPYPPATADLHHEIELVVALGEGGRSIPEDRALDHVHGYGVGIDLTRRDLQGEAKKHGRPWDTGKGFDASAPCTPIHPVADVGHPERGRIWLEVGGQLRQEGDLAEMIWTVPEMISLLSGLFLLKPGDLIFTGTPAGVAALQRGDRVTGGVEGLDQIEIVIA